MKMKLQSLSKKAIFSIIIVFSLALVFFFLFAAEYGDGLERTMEEGEVEEGEPAYSAPLDYGDNYFVSLLSGIAGFFAVLVIIVLILKIMGKNNETHDN